jgi:hypothetical protein
LKASALLKVISAPSLIVEVRIISRQPVQGLDRVVADPDVDEVLFDELADPGDVRVVVAC